MIPLRKIALYFYRSPEELKKLNVLRVFRIRFFIFAFFFGFLLSYFAYTSYENIHEWSRAKPTVRLPATAWTYLAEKTPYPCDPLNPQVPGCPANPANPLLWESPNRLNEKHRIAGREVSKGETYWIGVVISDEQVQKAFKEWANYIILGKITGDHSIWVDGEFYFESNRQDREAAILTIPLLKMKRGLPLKIAVRVTQYSGSAAGFIAKSRFGQGLSNRMNLNHYLKIANFAQKARPISFFFSNLMLALLFFLFWAYAPEKQEYYYISLYALLGAVIQLKKVGVFLDDLIPTHGHTVQILLRLMEGVFAMVVGLSFSRTKRTFIHIILPSSIALALVTGPLIKEEVVKVLILRFLDVYSGGVGCLIGAFFCFLQAYYLTTDKGKGDFLKHRQWRLVLFAIGLTGASLFYFYPHFASQDSIPLLSRWATGARFGQILLMIYLFILAALDFRSQKGLLEKTPISKYHRLPQLPEKLSGAILVVDLKNSEYLLRAGAEKGDSGKLVHACLSHMWTAVLQFNGVLLLAEGDMLRAFFDQANCPNPVFSALSAVDAMAKNLELLRSQFELKLLGNLGNKLTRLSFRGAISPGDIRPVWSQVGDIRYPEWIGAGTSNPFLDSARLLELEREFEKGDFSCQVAVMETEAKNLEDIANGLSGKFTARNQMVAGKHGMQYTVAIYNPEKESPPAPATILDFPKAA